MAKKNHTYFRRHFYSLIISLFRLLQEKLTYLDSINFDRLNSRRHDQHDCYNKEFTKADLHRDWELMKPLPRLNSNDRATVSDKNTWDTLTKRCFFPSRAPLVPLKVVYRGLVTKSCTPTLRGQGDPKVSQPFWLRLCFWGILGMWLLVGSSGGKSLGRHMHVSEPFFREKH